MSWEASVWALKQAPVFDAQRKLILMGLADHATDTGRRAYPSQATLALYACCSRRTVGRALADLEAHGLIRRGDQRHVAHIPKHLRPVVWDLALVIHKEPVDNPEFSTEEEIPTPGQSDMGCHGRQGTLVTGDVPPTSPVTHKPSFEPSEEPPARSAPEKPRSTPGQPPSLAALRAAERDECEHCNTVGRCAWCRRAEALASVRCVCGGEFVGTPDDALAALTAHLAAHRDEIGHGQAVPNYRVI